MIFRLLLTASLLNLLTTTISAEDFSRWDKSIAAFEKQDLAQSPEKGGVVFVGSSSIRLWDLEKSFPNSGYLNRGFGGSQIADANHFIEQLVLKHEPKIVVMYAGDNDIAAKKTPQRVAKDFKTFAAKLHKALPETYLIYVAIKPSVKRWEMWPKMNEANELIARQCAGDKRLTFLDIAEPMIGDDGEIGSEWFVADGLHLNEQGYALWTKLVQQKLKQVVVPATNPDCP